MMKPVGKPDAGNRHVRFDERGRETERCRMAQATALFLDSTKGEELSDGCGEKRAIHVANRCSNELRFGSALRHSRHDQRASQSTISRLENAPSKTEAGRLTASLLNQRRSGLHPSIRCPSSARPDSSAAWLAREKPFYWPLPPFGPSAARRRLLCPRLTPAPRSDRLAATSVSLPGHGAGLPR